MVKFTSQLKDGTWLIYLGLSAKNIERLKEGDPIIVIGKELGLENVFENILIAYNKKDAPAIWQNSVVVYLGDAGIEKLLSVGIILSQHLPDKINSIVLDYGKDPNAIVKSLKTNGILSKDFNQGNITAYE